MSADHRLAMEQKMLDVYSAGTGINTTYRYIFQYISSKQQGNGNGLTGHNPLAVIEYSHAGYFREFRKYCKIYKIFIQANITVLQKVSCPFTLFYRIKIRYT